jgi:hypothetical protein
VGNVTDVSLHGCYVEMNITFPAGTKAALVLKSFGIRIETPGTVRASYPFLGMDICFAEIEPVQQMQLKLSSGIDANAAVQECRDHGGGCLSRQTAIYRAAKSSPTNCSRSSASTPLAIADVGTCRRDFRWTTINLPARFCSAR